MKITMPDVEGVEEWAVYAPYAPYVENMEPVAILRPGTTVLGDKCGRVVYWWDGEYEGECCLPLDHTGPHYDGVSWYDDDLEEVEGPEEKGPNAVSFRCRKWDKMQMELMKMIQRERFRGGWRA